MRNKFPIIYCLQCSTIPILHLYPNSLGSKLSSCCSCTKDPTIKFNLTKYIRRLSLITNEIKKTSKNCQSVLEHYNKKSKGYCVICEEYLCGKCIKSHKYKNHSLIPFALNIKLQHKKKHKDILRTIYYSFDAHCSFCIVCGRVPKWSHCLSISEILSLPIEEIIKQFNQVKKNFKRLLKEILSRALKEHPRHSEELRESMTQCIKQNKFIFIVLEYIFYTFKKVSQYNFPLYYNIYVNANFTICESNFKRIPNLNNKEKYVSFFNSFFIIENKNKFPFYKESPVNTVSFNSVGDMKHNVIAMNIIKERKLILLANFKGDIHIYDMNTDEVLTFPGHQDLILSIEILSNDTIITASKKEMKMWKLFSKNLYCIIHYSFHLPFLNSVAAIASNKFAIALSDGTILISTRQSMMPYDMNKIKLSKISSVIHLFYSKKQNLLIQTIENTMYFLSLDPLIRDHTVITNVPASPLKNAYCITSKGKIIVGGKLHNQLMIVVINIDSKQIETQYENRYLFNDALKARIFIIVEDKEGNFALITTKGRFIMINRDTLEVTTVAIMKYTLLVHFGMTFYEDKSILYLINNYLRKLEIE